MDCFKKKADINWSFWSAFLVVVLFILFIAVGIKQSFCHIVTATGMKDPKIYIFLGIILVGIFICLILFQRIYSLLLLYNDMEKRKIQLLINTYKEDNNTKNEIINNLRNEISRLQDLLSDDVFKENRSDMAKIYTAIGELFLKLDKADDAEKQYLKALELYKSLVKANPDIYINNENVASAYLKIANVHIKKNQNKTAKKNYEKAIECFKKLAKDNPKKINKQLAQTYFDLASLLKKDDNLKDAIPQFEQAMHVYLELEKDDTIKIEGIAKISDELIPLINNDSTKKKELKVLFEKASKILQEEYPERNDILTKIENFLKILDDVVM